MVNKPKKQGTEWETKVVEWFRRMGLRAMRLAEGGNKDEGDVLAETGFGLVWVECKSAERLNVTRVLEKARAKSPKPASTVLFWKRLTKKEGAKRRSPDGTPVVVCMGLDTYGELIGARHAHWSGNGLDRHESGLRLELAPDSSEG